MKHRLQQAGVAIKTFLETRGFSSVVDFVQREHGFMTGSFVLQNILETDFYCYKSEPQDIDIFLPYRKTADKTAADELAHLASMNRDFSGSVMVLNSALDLQSRFHKYQLYGNLDGVRKMLRLSVYSNKGPSLHFHLVYIDPHLLRDGFVNYMKENFDFTFCMVSFDGKKVEYGMKLGKLLKKQGKIVRASGACSQEEQHDSPHPASRKQKYLDRGFSFL